MKDYPYHRSGVVAHGGKVRSDFADAEPVPQENYGYEHESVELCICRQELLTARVRVRATHANVAEYQPQYYRNEREPVDDVPNGTVGTIFSGSVVNRLDYRVNCDYRRNYDQNDSYDSLEGFHENVLLFPSGYG